MFNMPILNKIYLLAYVLVLEIEAIVKFFVYSFLKRFCHATNVRVKSELMSITFTYGQNVFYTFQFNNYDMS